MQWVVRRLLFPGGRATHYIPYTAAEIAGRVSAKANILSNENSSAPNALLVTKCKCKNLVSS
jgi:hypothetical protein